MAPQTRSTSTLLGTVLVVGGCGFLGFHLVRHLLQNEECGPIHVLDRNIENNRHADAEYHRGDITDAQAVDSLINKIRPRAIFHAASPIASLPGYRWKEYQQTNIRGTEILLAVAAECSSVEAFIFTSTIDVYANPPHNQVDESHPLWPPSDRSNQYNRTKAIADQLVRAANDPPRLLTACLRPGHMYGERYKQGLVETLDLCSGTKRLVQVGRGENRMAAVSGDNAALAHLLTAKALLDPQRARGRVDGEAFNVADGEPVLFWHHIKVIWAVARGEDAVRKAAVIPGWIMVVLVFLVEWALWIFTLDTLKPPSALGRTSLAFCLYDHTYSLKKARTRLLFEPVDDHDEVLKQAVEWELERRRAW